MSFSRDDFLQYHGRSCRLKLERADVATVAAINIRQTEGTSVAALAIAPRNVHFTAVQVPAPSSAVLLCEYPF
jgi:hypothetical protein